MSACGSGCEPLTGCIAGDSRTSAVARAPPASALTSRCRALPASGYLRRPASSEVDVAQQQAYPNIAALRSLYPCPCRKSADLGYNAGRRPATLRGAGGAEGPGETKAWRTFGSAGQAETPALARRLLLPFGSSCLRMTNVSSGE